MERVEFLGLTCVELKNERVRLLVTESAGPRILSFSLMGGENVLAELPAFQLACPGAGMLSLLGGHRLWHAPEVQRRTYLPDDSPVAITPITRGLHVLQDTETQTGLQKSMTIQLADDESAMLTIDHQIANHGMWPVECAPWAITQLRPGGVAILPQRTTKADPDGLQPNRSMAFWTYSDVAAPYLHLGNDHIRVRAEAPDSGFKIGFPNDHGWLAYVIGDQLFSKRAEYDPQKWYYDRQSSSQCYCNRHFLELETLGPRESIAPGDAINHREIWQLIRDPALLADDEQLFEIVAQYA